MIEFGETYKKVKYKAIIRKYIQPKFTFYSYDSSGNNPIESNSPVLGNRFGSSFIRFTEFEADNPPSKLSLTDQVQVKTGNLDDTAILNSNHPIFKMESNKTLIINKDVNFAINMEIKFLHKEWTKLEFITSAAQTHIKYIKTHFKIGNYYYNGETEQWTTQKSYIQLPFTHKKGEMKFNNWKWVDDQNDNYELGLDSLKGYIFKAPSNILANGKLEFVIYAPDEGFLPYLYMREISIKYQIPKLDIYDDWVDEENKNDVVYENEISDDYEEEADSIDLKICTFPEDYTKLCYSTTYINNNLLKTLTYKPLNITDIPEKIIINKIIDYYKNPKYQLTVGVQNKEIFPYTTITDQNSPNKVFCYIGNEIDYEFESNNINLIEI